MIIIKEKVIYMIYITLINMLVYSVFVNKAYVFSYDLMRLISI